MDKNILYRAIGVAGAVGLSWLLLKYLFPVLLPFGIGLLLALSAEPVVRVGVSRFHLPRWAASGLGVGLTLFILTGLFSIVGVLSAKALTQLAGRLPDLQSTTRQAQSLLLSSVKSLPESIRPLADKAVEGVLNSGNQMISQAGQRLPSLVSSLVGWLSEGALSLGTGLFSAFLFSVRLPRLKALPQKYLPEQLRDRLFPALKRSRRALLEWLKAQGKLCGITFCILLAGFLLLRIPHGPIWALVVAVVDAVPILGTGTVLLPWALVCLLQRNHLRSIGLLCLYGAAALTRMILEPRIVGQHLGLDPLATLLFLYFGFRFWGIPGMILVPMLAAAVTAAFLRKESPSNNEK